LIGSISEKIGEVNANYLNKQSPHVTLPYFGQVVNIQIPI
jgi:hypothetical protein